jgi:hypothetical protein
MSTLDFDMNFEDGQQDEADKRLMIKFAVVPTYCEYESIQQGRPVYKDEEVIHIMVPGSRDVTANLVDDNYRRRFAKQYERFKKGAAELQNGTPLSVLVWLTPAQIAELNAVNCHTVEQLAGMPDNLAQKFMGAQALKQRAQGYLDTAKDQAPMLKLQAELEKRDETIAQMQAQLAQLIEAQKAPPKVPVKA